MSEQIIFITLPTLCIAALSSYTAYYSYVSITDVQMYEDQTKKVAEYSNIAEDALTQTRTTEGAGAFATLLSLATALTFAIITIPTSSTPSPPPSRTTIILSCIVNAAACLGARAHINDYWQGKAKIPLVTNYNEAISTTKVVAQCLKWMGGAWAVMGFVGVVVGS